MGCDIIVNVPIEPLKRRGCEIRSEQVAGGSINQTNLLKRFGRLILSAPLYLRSIKKINLITHFYIQVLLN